MNKLLTQLNIRARYLIECRDGYGILKWKDFIDNLVPTAGKNLMLDSFLAGSGYTVVGPYMGLVSSVSYTTGPAAGDTMASHAGWTEAGATNAPTYSGTRKTCPFSSASGGSKGISVAPQFLFTGAGTIKGLFIVLGTGAVATIDDGNGTLFSAGLFSGGDKLVGLNDTINVGWSVSL
jgi:hypothetical protein